MNCPACGKTLKTIKADEIEVDICEGGCGGIWFDWFELSKVDEPDEFAGEQLLDVARDPNCHVDPGARRDCPHCDDVVMMRHFFSVKREVAVDECPKCAGYWLDAGELTKIRNLFSGEAEAREVARALFGGLVDDATADQRAETEENVRRARRIAHMLRFICPSYYMPGKQPWGAH